MPIRIPILLAALVLTGLVSRSASVVEEMMKKLILRIIAPLAAVLLMGGTVYACFDQVLDLHHESHPKRS
jgi:hypothetical protein